MYAGGFAAVHTGHYGASRSLTMDFSFRTFDRVALRNCYPSTDRAPNVPAVKLERSVERCADRDRKVCTRSWRSDCSQGVARARWRWS